LHEVRSTDKTTSSATAVATTPVATSGDDPNGVKAYIAFSIAYSLYPDGNGVDPDQDISDNAKLNSDILAATINKNALTSAKMHQLVWTLITADQVAKLVTVNDLMNLVKGNLAAAAARTGT